MQAASMAETSDVQISGELRFLMKPFAEHPTEAVPIPETPLLSEIFPKNLTEWPSKVVFKAWKQPPKQWTEWVLRLAPKFVTIWTQAGIQRAIMKSAYESKCSSDLVLSLSQFWCPQTNTFIFPWGEATVTLHEVAVLTGLPVVGDSVASEISDDSVKSIVDELEKQRIKLNKTKSKKPSHGAWIKNFMEEEEETELEHAGFLTMWLSRFVFPSLPDQTIQKNLFPLAANLSLGKPLALGMPFLATIYRDLTKLHNDTVSRKDPIFVVAPCQFLEMWVQDHFKVILKGYSIDTDFRLVLDLPFVQSVPPVLRKILEDPDEFVWYPNNEHLLKDNEQFLLDSPSLDVELRSFRRSLQCFELVGLDCKERYSPQRVAMQFGMDQHLPAQSFQTDSCDENMGFIVPPRSYQASFSVRYLKWWKQMMVARQGLKLEGKYEKFSEYLKKRWIDEHLHCSDSSATSGESSDDDLIPIATQFKTRHGNHGSTSKMSGDELVDDISKGTMDFNGGERIQVDKRVLEAPAENNDGRKGSESTCNAKRKKVKESTSKSVDLDNGLDVGR